MRNLSDTGVIKEILYRHGFALSKSLGQNFLVDPDICPAMAKASGARKGTGVLEIGPGIGILTPESTEDFRRELWSNRRGKASPLRA